MAKEKYVKPIVETLLGPPAYGQKARRICDPGPEPCDVVPCGPIHPCNPWCNPCKPCRPCIPPCGPTPCRPWPCAPGPCVVPCPVRKPE